MNTSPSLSPPGSDLDGLVERAARLRFARLNYTNGPWVATVGKDLITGLTSTLLSERALRERVEGERDEALDRVEELERDAEIVSAEFEKECWQAVRSLLVMVGVTDFSEGVTAQDACEILADEIRSSVRRAEAAEHRSSQLEAELKRRKEALKQAREVLDRCGRLIWKDTRSAAFDVVPIATALNAIDAALQPQEGGN